MLHACYARHGGFREKRNWEEKYLSVRYTHCVSSIKNSFTGLLSYSLLNMFTYDPLVVIHEKPIDSYISPAIST